jgi:hypothetical protein
VITTNRSPIQRSQLEEGFDLRTKVFEEVLEALERDVPLENIVDALKSNGETTVNND